MSLKGKSRIEAKTAVGDLAKVNKVAGKLIVLRTTANGRMRDWQRAVVKAIRAVLPNWEATKINKGTVIFSLLTRE